jgi:hypothetical protein
MNSHSRPLRTLAATLATATLITGVPAQAAPSTARPTAISTTVSSDLVTYRDGVQDGGGHDIVRVALRSAPANTTEASVTLTFDEAPAAGDGQVIWFNLDADPRPEAVLTAYAYSEWQVARANGWNAEGININHKGCFTYRAKSKNVKVTFNPDCFAPASHVSVSAAGFHSDSKGSTLDYAPGKKKWTAQVDAHAF